MNPRSNVASTKIITNSHIFAINNQYQNETVNVQLPFLFPFYGIVYSHIAISPLGQWFLRATYLQNTLLKPRFKNTLFI